MVKLNHSSIYLIILIIAGVGMALVASATRWGVGTSPDSAVYIGAARNLASGKGFTIAGASSQDQAITHYPPLYPAILALGGVVGVDPLIGARWMDIILFALILLLAGWILNKIIQEDRWLVLVGVLLLLISTPLLTVSTMAWSEPVFILLFLASFLFLARFIETQRPAYLFPAAVLMAFALLDRYAGITLVATACLGILVLEKTSWKRKILGSLTLGLIAVLPLLVWLTRNLISTGSATNREFVPHFITLARIWQGFLTLADWLLIPGSLNNRIVLSLLLIVTGSFIICFILWQRIGFSQQRFSIRSEYERMPVILKLLLFFIPIYLIFLVFSISFFDANTPLDQRILSPVFISLVISSIYLAERVLITTGKKWVTVGIIVISGIFCLGYARQAGQLFLNSYQNGIGYSSRVWLYSETISEVKNLPEGTVIYSNAPEGIYLRLNRQAKRIPRKTDLYTGLPDPAFPQKMEAVLEDLQMNQGALVYFSAFPRSAYPSEAELVQSLSLQPLEHASDGTIYILGSTE